MTETGAWTGSWTTTATPHGEVDLEREQAGGPAVPRRRVAGLWALLHAQSQLTGPADALALAEEDRYRLSRARGAPGPSLPHP